MDIEEENGNINGEEHGNISKNDGKKPFNYKIIIIAAIALMAGVLVGGFFINLAPGMAGLAGESEEDEVTINDEIEAEEEVNGFEEARPHLEEQLKQQKEQELLIEHLEDLKAASEIEKSLEVIGQGDENATIATVNGEEIKKDELIEIEEQQIQQLEMQGMDPESEEISAMLEQQREDILENLISTVVLKQKVEEEDIAVSDAEIEEQYQQIAQQFGGEEMLEQQMETEGLTRDELEEQIAEQLPIQIYLESYVDEQLSPEDLEFSEKELREMYELQQQQQQMQMPVQ